MILGIDASTWPECRRAGARFWDGDVPMDPLDAFRRNGVTYMRLRLWNKPFSAEGAPYLGGTCDMDTLLEMARLSADKGYRLLLDLHYSDFWADPAKQVPPKDWAGMGLEALEAEVFRFTRETLETLRAQGLAPHMIQVGNEITNGMLWPVGRLTEGTSPRGNYPSLIRLLKAGIRACREVCPGAEIALHLERSGDSAVYQEFFGEMERAGVDYDIIGASYYPYWHGSFDDLLANLDACARFGKPRMVLETSYGFTDESPLEEGGGLMVGGAGQPYPLTPRGQAEFVTRLLALCREHGVAGVFYWEPLWITGEGTSWASEEGRRYIGEEDKPLGNERADQCLFDYSGRKLPAFDCFRA